MKIGLALLIATFILQVIVTILLIVMVWDACSDESVIHIVESTIETYFNEQKFIITE